MLYLLAACSESNLLKYRGETQDALDSITIGSMCRKPATHSQTGEAKESVWQAPHLAASPAALICWHFCCPTTLSHSGCSWHRRCQLGGNKLYLPFPRRDHQLPLSFLPLLNIPALLLNPGKACLHTASSTILFAQQGHPLPFYSAAFLQIASVPLCFWSCNPV